MLLKVNNTHKNMFQRKCLYYIFHIKTHISRSYQLSLSTYRNSTKVTRNREERTWDKLDPEFGTLDIDYREPLQSKTGYAKADTSFSCL